MENEEHPEVIPYDLRSQDRIIRGRLPTFEIIHDRFVRMFRITLSGALRLPVDVRVRSTHLVKFGEFLKMLPVPSSLNLFGMSPLAGAGIMVLETRLVFTLLDIFYGGAGMLEVTADGRDFTPIEQRLVKRVVISALEDLQVAWNPVFPVHTQYFRTEINPQFVAIVPQSEVVVIISFDVDIGGAPMALTLCIPYSMIEPIRSLLDSGFQSDQGKKGKWAQSFAGNLDKAKVTLVARTGFRPISIREFIGLKEGDFLLSDHKPEHPLGISINGVNKLKGLIREDKGRQTVEVTEVIQAHINSDIAELRKEAEEISRIKASETKAGSAQDPKTELESDSVEERFSLVAFLNDTQPEIVADLFKVEHPQTIALILAHIDDAGKTAKIIERLPQKLRADVTCRLAVLESIPPGVFKEIEMVIGKQVQSGQLMLGKTIGGIGPAGQSLRSMEPEIRQNILTEIRKSNPDLADQLDESMNEQSD